MLNNHAPLPPPPPPLLTKDDKDVEQIFVRSEIEYEEAIAEYLFLEASKLGYICEPIFKYFRPISTIIQNGPTCGMVALAMGLNDKAISVEMLCGMAKSSGWSLLGEMYNCHWMTELAKNVGAKAVRINGGIHNHLECIFDCIIRGGSLLVPYDKNKDYSPGLLEGAKAHWALVTGIILLESSSSVEGSVEVLPCKCIETHDRKLGDNTWQLAGCSNKAYINLDENCLRVTLQTNSPVKRFAVPYFCAFQGQSRRVKIWPMMQLAASNNNLNTEGESRVGKVKVPEGGVAAGLRGQAILLMPKK